MIRRRLLLTAALAAGAAVEWATYEPSLGLGLAVLDLCTGWALFVCGALAWERQPESRVGLLMSLTGTAWFLGTAAQPLVFLHRGPLVHLYLTHPTGRIRSRLARTVILAAYVDGAIERLARNETVTLALAAAVAAVALYEFVGAEPQTPPAALVAAFSFASMLALLAIDVDASSLWAYDLVIASSAVLLLVDLLRRGRPASVAAGLVVDLGNAAETGTLRAKLAHVLGDPSLVVGYRLANTDGFVDDAGRPVALPRTASDRAVTPLVDRGERIAVLIHDGGLAADRRLVDAVAAVARIALANVSLQAEARAKEDELAASRRRIVEAGDAERRRIGDDLRRATGESLARVAGRLERARTGLGAADAAALARLERELVDARGEVEEFARGVLPTALTDGGLEPALAELAARAAVPVEVRGRVQRLPSSIEVALYFVCSEALANVGKHAGASRASIELVTKDGRVCATILDDGVGGADLSAGTGLRGLADRVDALGGRLLVTSPAGRGTQVAADIPISSRA